MQHEVVIVMKVYILPPPPLCKILDIKFGIWLKDSLTCKDINR